MTVPANPYLFLRNFRSHRPLILVGGSFTATEIRSVGQSAMRSSDKYTNYKELRENERAGRDYLVKFRPGHSGVVVMAPHGGDIEPGTTEIADAVASGKHDFYAFEGIKDSGNWDLHLASTRFDEPLGLDAARRAQAVVTIHGCKEKRQTIYIGGRDEELKTRVALALVTADFCVAERSGLQGKSPQNICNLSATRRGIQLEISAGLRRTMFKNLSREGRELTNGTFDRLVQAVRSALYDFEVGPEAELLGAL